MCRIWSVLLLAILSFGPLPNSVMGDGPKAPADPALPLGAIQRIATDSNPPAKRNGPGYLMAVAVSPDGKYVATGENYIVRVFERLSGRAVRTFPVTKHQIADLAFTPDGKGLLMAVAYHPAQLWNLETGKETRTFDGALGSVRGVMRVAYNADASLLALAVPEPAIQIVDPTNGKILRKLGLKQMIDRVAFSPDGRSLAAAGFNKALQLWDATTGKEKWTANNGSSIVAVAFSPNGKQIATGDYSALKLWDAQSGQVQRILGVGPGAVRAVAFSPDGRLAAAAGDHNDAVVFECATGVELMRFAGHNGPIWSLAFSPDDQTLVTGSHDTTALVWDITGRKFIKPPPDVIADADLKKHWKDLATTAGTTGGHAVWSLMVLDKKALPFLEDRLRISELPNAKMITALIAQLDDEDFAVREDATKSLSKLGKSAAAELRRALSKNPAAETKARLEALLRPLSEDDGDPRLRAQRVLAALEHMTAPDAQKLLEHLADKEVDEDVRRDAAAAVRRIKARVAAQ